MRSKNILKFGCYALTVGLVVGGLFCSPRNSSLIYATDDTVFVTKRPIESSIGAMMPITEKLEVIELPGRVITEPLMPWDSIGPGDPLIDPIERPIYTLAPITKPPLTPAPETPAPITKPPVTLVPVTPTPVTPTPVTPTSANLSPTATVTMVPTPVVTEIDVTPKKTKNTDVSTDKPVSEPEVIVMPEETPVPNFIAIVQRFYVGMRQYYVNDKKNEMDTTPIVKDGRTLMPIRYVSETFGAKVDWDDKDKKVTISFGEKRVELWIGKDAALVDGTLKRLDVAPEIIDGRTVLPLRFVSENLGLKVQWDNDLKEIKVTN